MIGITIHYSIIILNINVSIFQQKHRLTDQIRKQANK